MKLGMINGTQDKDFEKTKALGLEFIEICANFDEDDERLLADKENIKERIQRYGIPVLSFGRWNKTVNVGGKVDEKAFSEMVRLLDLAEYLGSPVFVCGCNYDGDVSLFRNYACAIEYFSRMVEEGKKRNLKIAVYNCSWNNFVYKDSSWEVVLGEVPDLYIKYDTSHCLSRGGDYLGEMNKWLPRIAHMHVKGMCKVNGEEIDNPPAGIDMTNWPMFFALLYRYGYQNTLSIEPHSGIWTGELGEKGLEFTIKYIKQFIL